MEQNRSRASMILTHMVWKLVGLSLLVTILLTTFFIQANGLFGQNHKQNIETMSSWNTAVTFPNNQNAHIAHRIEIEMNTIVPDGAVSGDVFVNTETGTSNGASFQLGSSFIPTETGEADLWDSTFSGVIGADTTWDTNLLLTGDVTVPAGITLTINADTTIFITSNNDDQNSGIWNDKTELLIFGKLLVNGSESAPVYFTSNAANKSAGDWGGIQIREGSTTSELSNCMIRYAIDGVRLTSQDIPGGGDVWATIQNCSIQNNETGIKLHAHTHYPDGIDLHVGAEIKNNLIANNIKEGIFLWNWDGYKSVLTDPFITNNVIRNNNSGVFIRTGSWWWGHVDDRTIIKNNTISNNETYGIFIEVYGSSDTSGSDTDAKPIIERNLLYENHTNIFMALIPQGSDGLQDFQPIVRYNTVSDASFGIVISDTQSYDTFIPTIDHNVFKGFADLSSYAIANQSSRIVNIDHNYWGSTPEEWDAGMPPAIISGTVNNSSPLGSTSPPIITRFASEDGQPGESITIYGANFGTMPKVYLPAILNQTFVGMEPIFIGDEIPQQDVQDPGEVFYSTTIQVPQEIPLTGTFYLSAQPDAIAEVLVDDKVVIKVGDSVVFSHDFSTSGLPKSATLVIPRSTMEQMVGQTVMVEYFDVYGNVVSASEMWLIWIP
ncbi:MAG: right-handed parallel beta-helix repeat-containing protein [Chloroflexi bacterium]|nr:right-handed parallel beta-helix repeat-containing protein [Chloroflexota bacterium]